MPISLRIPSDKEKLIRQAAKRAGKTKTAFILEAVYEKIGLGLNRSKKIRELAGWMSKDEAKHLRQNLAVFEEIQPGDWE